MQKKIGKVKRKSLRKKAKSAVSANYTASILGETFPSSRLHGKTKSDTDKKK